jgi:3'-phosphoadenosine 5'-phosphosulfate sulfotransferase (PAPS reductase)/FAD synthetase
MSTVSLPLAHKADSVTIMPWHWYSAVIVSFSGGKDSLASVLSLLEQGCPPSLIQLWHQDVDGGPDDPPFMDWPVTRAYVRAVADALGLPVFFQYREGGFLGEMMKEDARTRPVRFQRQDGTWAVAGGLKGKIATRRRFPQPTANLAVRWCSAVLKIDTAALALNNDPALRDGRVLFVTGERR